MKLTIQHKVEKEAESGNTGRGLKTSINGEAGV